MLPSPDITPSSIHEPIHTFIQQKTLGLISEINRLSPTKNGTTLLQIAEKLQIQQFIPQNLESNLIAQGIHFDPHIPARRKADVVTTSIAAKLMEKDPNTPLSRESAITLLGTRYSTQLEMTQIRESARNATPGIGLSLDLAEIQQQLGDRYVKQISENKLDRSLACAVITIAKEKGLSIRDTTNLLDVIHRQIPSKSIEISALVPKVREMIKISSQLKNTYIPLREIPKNNVSMLEINSISKKLIDQAEKLKEPGDRRLYLKEIVEQGTIPEAFSSLTDILDICKNNPEIRAVSFDMYDTLVQWSADVGERYEAYPKFAIQALKKIGIQINEQSFQNTLIQVKNERYDTHIKQGKEAPFSDILRDTVQRLKSQQNNFGDATQEQKAIAALSEAWYKHVELDTAIAIPGARETLIELKKMGIDVCITSNAAWPRTHIERVLRKFGLLEFFPENRISISSEAGIMKKQNLPDFYHYSWNKLGIPYQHILHVGDNKKNDFIGARNAGSKSSEYINPLGSLRRIELSGIRYSDPYTYQEACIDIHKRYLEQSSEQWIQAQINKRNIPENERERLTKLSSELYFRCKDILSPMYISMADQALQGLNENKYDMVLSLSRDGLPISVAMKLLLAQDPQKYPNVKPNQIHYNWVANRQIMDYVLNPTTPEHTQLQQQYYEYLKQINPDWKDKKILITDIGTGGTTQNLFTKIATTLGAQSIRGLYINTPANPNRTSFLTESAGGGLPIDIALFQLESLFNGPFEKILEFKTNEAGTAILPKTRKKEIKPEGLTRGLGSESVRFFNDIAIRALIDATKMVHRTRLLGKPDATAREVSLIFLEYQQQLLKTSIYNLDDLSASIPWPDSGQYSLPANNTLLKTVRKNNNIPI